MADVIQASGLVKTYGKVRALDGLDLAVPEGTVLGAARAERRRQDDGGAHPDDAARRRRRVRAEVAGFDVRTQPGQVRAHIGVSGQYAAVDEYLTGFENLDMVGRLYGLGAQRARRRGRRELLEQFSLADAGRPAGQDLLRRHAAPPRPRRRAGRRSRRCCSWTSRPPGSIRAAASRCGTSSPSWSRAARRCC